jgi:dolichol-phosphate mannosyltransferase
MKMAITGWAYRTINRLSEVKIPVDTGDYKLISRKVLDHMNSLPEHDPYFRGMVSWVGFKQEQLLYRRDPRPAGRSTRSLMSFIPLRVFVSAVLASSTKPLVWIALSCIPLFLLSVMGLVLLALFPTSTLTLAYSAGLCILMLLSVQLSLGAVGLYLARVYHDVRGRPAYLIKETIGS